MVSVRTNLCPNPRYIGTDGATGGGSPEWTQTDLTSDGPDGRGYTRFDVTTDQSGSAYLGGDTSGSASGTPGTTYSASAYLMSSRPQAAEIRMVFRTAAGGTISYQASSRVSLTPEVWTRFSVTAIAPAGTVDIRINAAFIGATLRAGDSASIACRLIEARGDLGMYFDGDTPGGKYTTYAWTGEANASTSTETYTGPPSITATVLTSSTEPPPIQLVINDVPEGDTYAVEGIGPGGRTWEVAGGHGVSEGVQVVLIDNRAPVNVPVRYRLVTPVGTDDSETVTRPWMPTGADPKVVVQSLDGRTIVPIAAWIDNQLPRQPELRTAGFPIRGRRRPVMVLAVAGEGTMQVVWRLDRAASAKLDQIIAAGGGIALVTDGTARGLPVSDTAVITSASSALWEADNGISTDRVWDLELTWIDDPEPSTIPVEWDVSEVDALLFGKTVAEVDAQFAGMTVAAVDSQDWGTVSGSSS